MEIEDKRKIAEFKVLDDCIGYLKHELRTECLNYLLFINAGVNDEDKLKHFIKNMKLVSETIASLKTVKIYY